MQIVEFLQNTLHMPVEPIIFIIAMVPIIELRGAIPIGIALMGKSAWPVIMLLSVLGNLVPVPFVMLLARPIFKWLKSTRLFKKLIEKQEAKIERNSAKILKYSKLGLAVFVGVPLPGTGAWTASMIADFLDMRIKNAFVPIAIGVIIAAIIVTLISLGVVSGVEWIIGK